MRDEATTRKDNRVMIEKFEASEECDRIPTAMFVLGDDNTKIVFVYDSAVPREELIRILEGVTEQLFTESIDTPTRPDSKPV